MLLFLTAAALPTALVAQDCAPAQGLQCASDRRFPSGTATYNPGLNENFAEYGTLFQDAAKDCCVDKVQSLLLQKVHDQNVQNGFTNKWLGGGDIYLITATALQLGAKHKLFSGPGSLDEEIQTALASYNFKPICVYPVNTCMDDFSAAAAGNAWAAAYEKLNGRTAAANVYKTAAIDYLHRSLSYTESVCLHPVGAACNDCLESVVDAGTLRSRIEGTHPMLERIEALTYNHDFANPNYGIGLLTSMSTAVEGLRVMGALADYAPSELEAVIAQGLLRQGQTNSSTAPPAWRNDNCLNFYSCQYQTCVDHTDDGPYTPDMYPVRGFLLEKLSLNGGLPLELPGPDQFPFDTFNPDAFDTCHKDFSDARLTAYRDLGFRWPYVANAVPVLGGAVTPGTNDPPQIWADVPAHMQTITGPTQLSGWAIDRESQVTSVSFQLDGHPISLQGFSYGGLRADVCRTLGIAKCPDCPVAWGGTFSPAGLTNGLHVLRVIATSADGQPATFDRNFLVSGSVAGGTPAIYWRNESTGANAAWLMNGTSYGSTLNLQGFPNLNYRMETAADFNGDGVKDILWRSYATDGSGGANAIWIMNGSSPSVVNLNGLPILSFHFQGAADFNGDGKPDIIIRNFANGENYVWIMNGTSYVSTAQLPGLPDPNYVIAGAADFNGDGHPDILWRNASTGANAIWLMNGTALLSTVNLPGLPNSAYHVGAVLDLNADGSPDIVWRSSSTGANAVWIMNGTVFSQTIVNLPILQGGWEMGGPR
jgi:hypothetical protein